MAALAPRGRYLAPDYVLKVEGTTLGEDFLRYVQTVEYDEGEELTPQISLAVSNPGFRLTDSKVWAEGNAVDLWMGYAGRGLVFQNRGTIVKPNPDMPRDGLPTIQVVAHARGRLMMEDSVKGEKFENLRDSEIVTLLLNRYGIRSRGGVRATREKLPNVRFLKKGTSPWEFIQRLTRLHGFELSTRFDPTRGADLAYWGPPEEAEPQESKFRFSYGTGEADATLLEFHPNMSLPSQSTRVEVSYTDARSRRARRLSLEVSKARAERTKFVGSSGTEPLRRPVGNGPTITFTVFGQREEVIADYPFLDAEKAKRLLAAWWARREREFVFSRGVVLGEPSLRKGQVHELVLPSKRLSGDWILTSVRHRISGGESFETEFTATKKVLQSKVGVADNASGVRQAESEQ